jgi:hypothetical protein
MRTIKNSGNAKEFPYKGEVNNQPSETIPDQTMSMREILTRYAKGLPIDGTKTPLWEDGEGYAKDPDTLDLAEREELATAAREELQQLNEKFKALKEKKDAKNKHKITDVVDENQE